jgi:hypothetical protein
VENSQLHSINSHLLLGLPSIIYGEHSVFDFGFVCEKYHDLLSRVLLIETHIIDFCTAEQRLQAFSNSF